MIDQITYNYGVVFGLASTVGQHAGVLDQDLQSVTSQTNRVAEFFVGDAHSAFVERQTTMISALGDLIAVMAAHGKLINQTGHSAHETDQLGTTYFV
ncbi:WXG100 family type VII secretion target [Mycolicibacillus parakoreensis]|uniref:WXG100 family type VII secretion target n=1 Tax=Mycolicibacillus parakoreensis TaxID=1069221 RepID=A0ABY3U4U2_9MYCO|nr:WXG100 family type VII secretion target [Mycolicibacillus parakoreensis]MCV7316547.1 WXG100 family type VII secretion target [Mycolicibacillus parakoreensis]ULN52771.1 WXG100 family type VII secretion target [Mycolicibacillus parakoreensis]HLR98229.1 WXG100 family type VII secretion target [Mycolicibacillus parakoreensis]